MEYAVDLGCYKGCPYPKLALEPQHEQEQLSRLVAVQGGRYHISTTFKITQITDYLIFPFNCLGQDFYRKGKKVEFYFTIY